MEILLWLVLYIVVGVIVHELFHKLACIAFGVKARFALFKSKKGFPIGLQFLPLNYEHTVKAQLFISISGFIGSVIVSVVFLFLTDYYLAPLMLIVFPILISLYDFRTIVTFIKKPKDISVSKAYGKILKGN